MSDGFTCHICAALVDPSAAQVAQHMQWHDALSTLTLRLCGGDAPMTPELRGLLAEDAAPPLTEAQVFASTPYEDLTGELPPFDEVVPPVIHAAGPTGDLACGLSQGESVPWRDFPTGDTRPGYCWTCARKVRSVRSDPDQPPDAPDPEPPPPPVERHPQIPEETWAELNADQRLDVAERMDRIASRQRTIDEGRNATDTAAATAYLTGAVADLREEYGIELLPAEELEEADLDVVDKPNPPRAREGMTASRLQERRRFLLAKRGLPGELEEDRQRELSLIGTLLSGPTPEVPW